MPLSHVPDGFPAGLCRPLEILFRHKFCPYPIFSLRKVKGVGYKGRLKLQGVINKSRTYVINEKEAQSWPFVSFKLTLVRNVFYLMQKIILKKYIHNDVSKYKILFLHFILFSTIYFSSLGQQFSKNISTIFRLLSSFCAVSSAGHPPHHPTIQILSTHILSIHQDFLKHILFWGIQIHSYLPRVPAISDFLILLTFMQVLCSQFCVALF